MSSTSSACANLDDLLFRSSGWFAIDGGNRRVRGVVVPSLAVGLGLVGEGSVATVVGRLRAGVVVVDVDLVDEQGDAAAEQLAGWCRRQDVWHLVRPSGGARGRYHVFAAAGDQLEDLTTVVAAMRTSMGASRKDLDVRDTVRPLSAPHRAGHRTRPMGDLREAARALRRHLSPEETPAGPEAGDTPSASASRSQRKGGAKKGAGPTVSPLTPRPRRRRDLPASWAAYLATGVVPPLGGSDHSRSTVEAIATGHLLRAGHDAQSAWDAITRAHPTAMVRARENRRRWLAWVWNRAVEEDNAHSPTPRVDERTAAAVTAARARLQDLIWAHPPRRRPTLLLVGHQVLDRMERSNSRRVPVPERDLVLDTGIKDRKVIREVLRTFHGPLGLLDTGAWAPTDRATSSFEFEIPDADPPPVITVGDLDDNGVRQIPPPSIHTPFPRGLWGQLPRAAHSLWRQLGDNPAGLSDLAERSGLTLTQGSKATASQQRSARAALTALAGAGLAHCTAKGTWVRRVSPTTEQIERAAAEHEKAHQEIQEERRAYRAGVTSAWSTGRARAAKAQRAREKAWWDRQTRAEQDARVAAWRRRFRSLSVIDQEDLKMSLVDRRTGRGENEVARHAAWVSDMDPDEFARRSVVGQAWFLGLAPPLQQAYVAAWERHRRRVGIRRGVIAAARPPLSAQTSGEVALLPNGPQERDEAFLNRQLEVLQHAIADSGRGREATA